MLISQWPWLWSWLGSSTGGYGSNQHISDKWDFIRLWNESWVADTLGGKGAIFLVVRGCRTYNFCLLREFPWFASNIHFENRKTCMQLQPPSMFCVYNWYMFFSIVNDLPRCQYRHKYLFHYLDCNIVNLCYWPPSKYIDVCFSVYDCGFVLR